MKRFATIILSLFLVSATVGASAQDWIRTGTGLGVEKIRLAVPDFKPAATDADSKKLATTFSTTLWNDLQAAGIFDMVSPSFYPLSNPATPQDVKLMVSAAKSAKGVFQAGFQLRHDPFARVAEGLQVGGVELVDHAGHQR